MDLSKKIFCTANAANYMHRALVFAKSVKRVYGDNAVVIICAVEKNLDFIDITKYPFVDKFFSVNDLNIPEFDKFSFKHNLMEMSCFVRPFLMEKVFNLIPDAELYYYMDCDTRLYSALSETDEILTNGNYNIALTPHTVNSPDYSNQKGERIHERANLRHGTFNLGFLGIANNEYAKEIITAWWKDRVMSACYWDIAAGVFMDQKWWNIAPYTFKGIHVEISNGYNYASWNILRRTITKQGLGYFINGQPLRFGHFSGTFNGHMGYAPVYGIEDRTEMLETLGAFCKSYYDEIEYFDKDGFSNIPWSLRNFTNGEYIDDISRKIYRDWMVNWYKNNPYNLSNKEFMDFATKGGFNTPREISEKLIEELGNELKKKNQELEGIKNSRSWKLLQILRKIIR